MLKLLLKKQLTEIFRNYFYDPKKNKARSRGAVVLYFVLFGVLMVGVLGGLFTFLSLALCSALYNAGMPWLYFLLIGLLASFLGIFGSVFNTYAGLYLPKDNDLLLSLPIPVRYILISRLLTVYLLGLLYSGIVFLPACIVYYVVTPCGASAVLGSILLFFLITIFVLTLSCALGWVVAKISTKLKNKSFLTVLLSVLFFGAYYFFSFKAQSLITILIDNAAKYGEALYSKAYPLYLFGMVGVGDAKAAAIVSAAILIFFLLVYLLLSRSFIGIATATGKSEKRAYKKDSIRQKSVSGALLAREFRRFAASPTYMLNCGLATLLLPVCGIAVLWKGKQIFPVLNEIFAQNPDRVLLLLCAAVCAVCAVNNTSEPSVSLEGNNLWIVRSLPLDTWHILRAKIEMHLILTAIPMLICLLCLFIARPASPAAVLLVLLQTLSFVLLSAEFGLYLGLKMPILNWVSEVTPIKQNTGVLLELLASALYCFAFGGLAFPLDRFNIGFLPYMLFFTALNLLLCCLLYRFLKRKGSAIFETL